MDNYKKTKEYLVCIDSDGCVMDTMDTKHKQCFGPKLVEVFNLESHRDLVLPLWNELNLYSSTRGINRFKGLLMILEILNDKGIQIDGLNDLKLFVNEAQSLGNPALINALEHSDSVMLEKALEWSLGVNEAIEKLPKEDSIYHESIESLMIAHDMVDVAVVSAANSEALQEEWDRLNVSQYPKIICGQEMGSKSSIIKELLNKGYKKENVLMIGDALGDLEAAIDNDVYFYPIVVGRENKSWHRFSDTVLNDFVLYNTYKDKENDYINEMKKVLK